MKLHKNSLGFGVIEALIVLVVVLVLGVGGWFVLHGLANTNTYKNDQYGFRFDYPKDWGSPTPSTTAGKTGSLYELSWPGKARAEFATKDYVPNNTGGVIHAQISLSCTNKDSQYVVWLYFDGPSCTSAAIFGLPSKTVTQSELVVTKKFAASSKLESIEFAFDVRKNQAIAGKADLQKLYSVSEQDRAIKLAHSIR